MLVREQWQAAKYCGKFCIQLEIEKQKPNGTYVISDGLDRDRQIVKEEKRRPEEGVNTKRIAV